LEVKKTLHIYSQANSCSGYKTIWKT